MQVNYKYTAVKLKCKISSHALLSRIIYDWYKETKDKNKINEFNDECNVLKSVMETIEKMCKLNESKCKQVLQL